jgi:EAL domain-containing protein (putative c-di-GMP-specific phosphodiesterase class I)
MYSAKESGRNALTIYESHMTQQVQARMELESDLRHALANHEFEVYYQPRVSVCTGELVGAEALVRWNHPTRGLVLPGEFISRCESTGMIAPLGDFVFRQAALQQKQWARAGFNLLISVNLSPKQFRDPELLTRMAQIVASTDCQPEYLELELTESMLLGKDSPTHNVLTTIRKMGFSLSVDDFGTGYSNLAYLNKFPIQALKIDKTFVQDIEANRPLAELIVSMCRLMKLHIVAEGVETPAQLAWVQSQGIEQYQGYLYAKPMAVEAFNRLLAQDLAPACGTHAT